MAEQIASKVPQIRFKGFDGEWEEKTVSDLVLSLDAGVSVNSADRAANSAEFGILKTSAVTNGVFNADENKVVLTESEQSRLKESVSGGTIIISRMNTPALVGANAYVESNHENLFLPDRLWAAKPRDGTSMRFLASILGSEKGRDALSKLAKGTSGSMKNITKPDVLAVSVITPHTHEQTKIGEYFRELDSLIGLHQRKHDKLVVLKKAMLQKMFPQPGASTPEIRFKGFSDDWLEKALGDIIDLGSGRDYKHLSHGNIPVYGTGGYMLSVNEALSTSIDAVGIGRKGTIDKPYILKAPFWTVDTLFYAIPKAENYLDFVYCIFQRIDWKQKDESTGVPSLSKVAINEISVHSTNPPEQQKIGNYFRTFDALIAKHATQLQKLRQIKSACLEKMFV